MRSSPFAMVPFEQAVEIYDELRKPVNAKERQTRIEGKDASKLYPYYGATGQVGYIDGYISDDEYVLLGEDGAPFLNPTVSKAYIIRGKAWVNNHAHVLRSKYSNSFLCHYLNYFNYKGFVSGTTRLKLTQSSMKQIMVPVPPLPEQERIVARIEELFSELDKAVETLQTTKRQMAVYRQAVLKEAFEGNYPQVPLNTISTAISGYAFKSKRYTSSGSYVVVKIGNVKQSKFDFSRDLTRTDEIENGILERALLKRGDCLITLTGSRGKRDYGYVSMITNETNFLLNQRVAALRFDFSKALPQFFQYYLSSPIYRNMFFAYETGNVGQGNVGIKALQEPIVICPSLAVQKQIVTDIESRLSVCDSIEQTVDTALQQAEALRQSILKEAFEGRL